MRVKGAGECVTDAITSGGILSSPVIAIVASSRRSCSREIEQAM